MKGAVFPENKGAHDAVFGKAVSQFSLFQGPAQKFYSRTFFGVTASGFNMTPVVINAYETISGKVGFAERKQRRYPRGHCDYCQ